MLKLRLLLRPFLLIVLMGSGSVLRADAISLGLGTVASDFTPDTHRYVRTYQDQFFAGKKLQGFQVDGLYAHHFSPEPTLRRAWLFGLGYNDAALSNSYSGGNLKLTRQTFFMEVGFRMEKTDLVPNMRFAGSVLLVRGITGHVKIAAPTGSETYSEEFDTSPLASTLCEGRAEYLLAPEVNGFFALRFPNFKDPSALLGVSYDLEK